MKPYEHTSQLHLNMQREKQAYRAGHWSLSWNGLLSLEAKVMDIEIWGFDHGVVDVLPLPAGVMVLVGR